MFYVLEGRCRIIVGDEEEELHPGTAAWGPPFVLHQLTNSGDGQCKILWVLSPPGREAAIIEGSRGKR
jgi:mannose-6-phosphate isomerase-like protein (cupin superfamily)